MRTCVIFNPSAKGDKARHFRRHLDAIGAQATLFQTQAAGDARRLAEQAVREGFETIVAAGGDGTVNEVVNGMAAIPEALSTVALGLLPLGTVNVFARELRVPTQLEAAWSILKSGKITQIDLPFAEFARSSKTGTERRFFAQMAGAGLDARAIERVSWSLKKKIGPLAYVYAGCQALLEPADPILVSGPGWSESGQLVLIGNGRLYGGSFQLFPRARLQDRLLEICVFKNVGIGTLGRCGPSLLLTKRVPESVCQRLQATDFELNCISSTPFELDGELVGKLPARFGFLPQRLRVVAPG